jgi:hypothetical protein
MLNGTYQIFDPHNITTVINTTYTNGQFGVTPMPMFLILLGAALVLLILAFREPIRDSMGSINVAKIGLSLCGAIVSAAAALSSFNIAENMGTGVATYNLYTTAVSSYSLWFSPYITGMLIISGVLCSILFIYTVTQPSVMITPDRDEYKSKASGERR